MYFPSYRMCKMTIEQLVRSFIFFFYCSRPSIRWLSAELGQPGLSGEPSWASRACRVCWASRASRRLHIDIIYNEGS